MVAVQIDACFTARKIDALYALHNRACVSLSVSRRHMRLHPMACVASLEAANIKQRVGATRFQMNPPHDTGQDQLTCGQQAMPASGVCCIQSRGIGSLGAQSVGPMRICKSLNLRSESRAFWQSDERLVGLVYLP